MLTRPIAFTVSFAVLTTTLIAGCSRSTDEEQIRAVIDATEKAVEARNTSDAMALIADDYRDDRGLDKSQLEIYLRGYFISHPKIALIVHIGAIKVETATRARARVEFARVGTQQLNSNETSLTGESEALNIDFRRIGNEWRVSRVDRVGRE